MPFASWYLTGSLMELPLAVLRADLQSLGFERQSGVCEPEDHLAALCEVMAVLIAEQHPDRNRFYERHLAPWVLACCRDQQQAKGAASTRRSVRLPKTFQTGTGTAPALWQPGGDAAMTLRRPLIAKPAHRSRP